MFPCIERISVRLNGAHSLFWLALITVDLWPSWEGRLICPTTDEWKTLVEVWKSELGVTAEQWVSITRVSSFSGDIFQHLLCALVLKVNPTLLEMLCLACYQMCCTKQCQIIVQLSDCQGVWSYCRWCPVETESYLYWPFITMCGTNTSCVNIHSNITL